MAAALMTLTTAGAADDGSGRAVYVMNEASGNRVMVLERASNGMLTPGQTVATGGLGSGQFEDSANGLILASLNADVSPNNLASNGKFLIANATIGDGAAEMATSDNRRYLYVRNALLGTLLAFRINADRSLTQIDEETGLPPNGIGIAAS